MGNGDETLIFYAKCENQKKTKLNVKSSEWKRNEFLLQAQNQCYISAVLNYLRAHKISVYIT